MMDAVQAEFARLCARQDALHQDAENGAAALATILRGISARFSIEQGADVASSDAEAAEALLAALDALPEAPVHRPATPANRATPRRRPRPSQPEELTDPQPEEQRLRRDTLGEQQQQQRQSEDLMEGVEPAPSPNSAVPAVAGSQQRAHGNYVSRASGVAAVTARSPITSAARATSAPAGPVAVPENGAGAPNPFASEALPQHFVEWGPGTVPAPSAIALTPPAADADVAHVPLMDIELVESQQAAAREDMEERMSEQLEAGGTNQVEMSQTLSDAAPGDALRSCAKSLNDSVAGHWKEVGSSHVRMSKLVEESSGADLSSLIAPFVRLDRDIVNKVVSDHLFRCALFDVARDFSKDAHIDVATDEEHPFSALHRLLSALRDNNRHPAIAWAVENRSRLAEHRREGFWPHSGDDPSTPNDPEGLTATASTSSASSLDSSLPAQEVAELVATNTGPSRLEFNLHRMEYLDLLENGRNIDALRYARQFLVAFVDDFLGEVQQLMGCLLFASGIARSPYSNLIEASRQQDLERMLSAEYCQVMDLTVESPLLSVVRCGSKALPILLKASQISSNWKELGVGDVLPVEIELGREYRFHTVFTCPVSREEATDESNKPMMLPCGHVLSKQSISRLPRGNQRFKCPYCPKEQVQSDCKPIRF